MRVGRPTAASASTPTPTTQFVDGGQRWCSGEAPAAIDPRTRATIERYTAERRVITADAAVSDGSSKPLAPAIEVAANDKGAGNQTVAIDPSANGAAPKTVATDLGRPSNGGARSGAGNPTVATDASRNGAGDHDSGGRAAKGAGNQTVATDPSRNGVGDHDSGGRPSKGAGNQTVATDPAANGGAPKGADTQIVATDASRTGAGDHDSGARPAKGAGNQTATGRDAMTAEQRYEAAERALASKDPATADKILAELVAAEPSSPLAAEALYERARLAFERRAWGEARSQLDALAAHHDAALAEPAQYLRCRIAVESRDHDAASCLQNYRGVYAKGPHDQDVLGLLTQLAMDAGGCAAAAEPIAELARTYPKSKLARAWLARCPEAQ